MRRLRLHVISLGLAACGGPRPAVVPAPEGVAVATAALLDSANVPGLSLALVSGGRIVWARGFGVRMSTAPDPVDTATVFEAASLSKPVFAYAVTRLVDQGLLDLDRPLRMYATDPDLPDDPRTARITARMVLCHTTGLQNERHPGERLALRFDPGTRFSYSGEAYTYLQHVVEAIVHVPLEQYMQDAVFTPLGMTRSSYVWETRFAANAAIGHDEYGDALRPARPVAPRVPSSLHTTAADYARFLTAMLTGQGLSPRSWHAMLTAQIGVVQDVDWGLGWALQHTDSGPVFWHWGDNSNTGFTAYAQGDTVRKTAFVFLTNSAGGLSLAGELIRQLTGEVEPGVAFMAYEPFNAPARRLGLELERRIRAGGVASGLALFDASAERVPGGPPETLLNRLGYRFLALGRASDAVAILRKNAERFPESANVYDSLGESLAALGDTAQAIASYRRSLQLDPRNANAVTMLRRLGATP